MPIPAPALATLLAVPAPAVAQIPLADPFHPGWLRTAEGCFVWNIALHSGETANWSSYTRWIQL